MAQIVGSVKSFTIGGRGPYPVAADADPTRDLGGITTERLMNGDSSSRLKAMPKPWKMESLTVALDDNDASQEGLQDSQDSLQDEAITVTFISGAVYSGTGSIEGDLKKSSQSGTADISLCGSGKLVKI